VSHVAKAASILLVRGSDRELFIVRRSEELRFLGGFVAFPGGKVSPTDCEIPIDDARAGADDGDFSLERRVAATRELFEETGVLLARRQDDTFPSSGSVLAYLRRKLLADSMTFKQVLDRLGARLCGRDLMQLGRITTPPFAAVRFDTVFYLAHLPVNQNAEIWPGELDQGRWCTPQAVVEQWTQGDCLVSPPTIAILKALSDEPLSRTSARLAPLFEACAGGPTPPIYFSPEVQMIPLRTQALPPTTHTNAFIVGRNPSYLIDPGPEDVEERQCLFAAIDSHHAEGGRLSAIVLTHQHPDHVGAAAICSQKYGVPIFAHALTARALQGNPTVQTMIESGERLNLGQCPDGNGEWHLEAIHTPGHASGHLAFYEPRYRLLFAGDMVSTVSSVVIAPPDGDLALYLASLRRLLSLECRLLLPGHGSPSANGRRALEASIAHRLKRENQLLAALGPTFRSAADLAAQLYKGLAPEMMRFAELQIQAGLDKLRREGRIDVSGSAAETEQFRRNRT